MVYRGKLSKACKECRSRKTRCDAAKPICAQCKRAGRICSGYQNIEGLRILDQSETIATRQEHLHRNNAKAKAMKKRRPTQPSRPRSRSPVPVIPFSPQTTSPTSSTVSSLSQHIPSLHPFPQPHSLLSFAAPSIFFAEYCNAGAGFVKTDMAFMAPVYEQCASKGMLAEVVESLGIVALARKSREVGLVVEARRRYCGVLRLTAGALGKGEEVVKGDEMLVTVWLLNVHESIVREGPLSRFRSPVHLKGAEKLLQMRGVEQFSTRTGQSLFVRMFSMVVLQCLQASEPVPTALMDLMRTGWNTQYSEAKSELDLLAIASRLCILISPAYNILYPDPRTTHQALLDLDADFAAWPATLSERYAFTRHESTSPALPPNYYDVYDTHISAVIWNSYRTIRIHANKNILHYAQLIGYSSRAVPDEIVSTSQTGALANLSIMAEEICYSIPYFLDKSVWCTDTAKKSSANAAEMTMYGGLAVIEALSLAADEEWVSAEMYGWMVGEIERIAEGTGIGRMGQLVPFSPPQGWKRCAETVR